MRHGLLFLSILFLTISSVVAQNDTDARPDLSDIPPLDSLYPAERVVYEMFDIQKPPAFPGGEKELLKFLAENIKFPPMTIENVPGPMAVSFIVEADGNISNKKILRGVEFTQMLIDMLDRMPRWSPGIKDGKMVAVQYKLPIRIRWE